MSLIEHSVAAWIERLRAGLDAPLPRPASTYRLQLTPDFGFAQAAELVPYLARLGITHLYLSPVFAAKPGSMHGYDVVDHNTLRPELGGEEGFAALVAAARAHGIGQIIDFVPNHMGIGPENLWWMDVLENGPSSVHAPFFDIDWKPVKDELENKVLVPLLSDQFGEVLERGELKLMREGGAFVLAYFEHRLPIAPRAVPTILQLRIAELKEELGESDVHLQELLSIITALEKLAPRHEVDPEKVVERAREKEVAKRRLAALIEANPAIGRHIDDNLRLFNGRPGDPRSFDPLEELLRNSAYRLADWRVAGEEINYRRFFDVNSLAAIRTEDESVFAETHRLTLRLLLDGSISGLRIDHPDGLYRPTAYFRRLQVAYLVERCRSVWLSEGERDQDFTALRPELERAVDVAAEAGTIAARPLAVVAEKILESSERMPAAWAVDGTTGYEFLNAVGGLFVATENAARFEDIYARFVGGRIDFAELVYEKKKMLMTSSMASELHMLSRRLNRLSETNRRTRDFTLSALSRALVEYVACLPIYRTYIEGEQPSEVEERDRRYVERTIARARRRSIELNVTLFNFLRDILLLRYAEHLSPEERRDQIEFVRKLQQVTPAITAKAIEDTAFYVYNRLVSLNEVGGNPDRFGTEVALFHRLNRERRADWPGSLNATSTHDTKRGEDVRLRIHALSEIPDEWEGRLARWSRMNAPHKQAVEAAPAPDANDELLFYQTLAGTCPDAGPAAPEWAGYQARIFAYLEKALREAKVHTSWTNLNEAYEEAMKRFAQAVLVSEEFLSEFVPFARRLAHAARLSSLSQVALKLASPGVTDVYQGCELEDLSLVDPDNRRPVDFVHRCALLDELDGRQAGGPAAREALAREVAAASALASGTAKLLLLREGLHLRRRDPELFVAGDYLPLAFSGPHAERVIGFARRAGDRSALVVAPRLVLGLLDESNGRIDWSGRAQLPTELPRGWREVVSGRRLEARGGALELSECFAAFPVALLEPA